MSKLPWMKFYPTDWSQDTVALSLAGRGAWITIVCAMWRSEERGKLSMPLAGFCRLLGAAEPETIAVLEELNVTGIASRVTEADKKVTLVCRRMVREHNSYRNHALRQQRYREAHQCDAHVTGEKSEVRSQKSEEEEEKRGVGAAPPPDGGILDLCNQIRNCRPEFRKLNQMGLENALKGIPLDDARRVVGEFCANMLDALKLPDNPIALLNGYVRKAGKPTQKDRELFPGEAIKLLEELRAQKERLVNRFGKEDNHRMTIRADKQVEYDQLCVKIRDLEGKVRGMV